MDTFITQQMFSSLTVIICGIALISILYEIYATLSNPQTVKLGTSTAFILCIFAALMSVANHIWFQGDTFAMSCWVVNAGMYGTKLAMKL